MSVSEKGLHVWSLVVCKCEVSVRFQNLRDDGRLSDMGLAMIMLFLRVC